MFYGFALTRWRTRADASYIFRSVVAQKGGRIMKEGRECLKHSATLHRRACNMLHMLTSCHSNGAHCACFVAKKGVGITSTKQSSYTNILLCAKADFMPHLTGTDLQADWDTQSSNISSLSRFSRKFSYPILVVEATILCRFTWASALREVRLQSFHHSIAAKVPSLHIFVSSILLILHKASSEVPSFTTSAQYQFPKTR